MYNAQQDKDVSPWKSLDNSFSLFLSFPLSREWVISLGPKFVMEALGTVGLFQEVELVGFALNDKEINEIVAQESVKAYFTKKWVCDSILENKYFRANSTDGRKENCFMTECKHLGATTFFLYLEATSDKQAHFG